MAHLATQKVLVARLAPTYAQAHNIEDDEARSRLEIAIKGAFLEQLLETTWVALTANKKKLDEEGLLEKVAGSLKDRPTREGKLAKVTPTFSAFLLLLDIEAGTATDAARRVLESPQGKELARAGIVEAGAFLATELTRK
ncbi:MAG: hypothetical protein ACJ790_12425 [Myxococcaceae bacterium]